MTIPNNPIVNAGLLYVNGLQIANTSPNVASKKLILVAGMARDVNNIDDIILSSNVVIDGTQVNANGVDVAPLVASTFYAVYVIGDSTGYKSTAGLLSLATNITPYLPVGYDMYRRIGWVLTDGSANIVQFAQEGVNENRIYYYVTSRNVLIGGSSTTYAAIDLSGAIPPLSVPNTTSTNQVWLNVAYTPALAANFAQFHYASFTSPPPGLVLFGNSATLQNGTVIVPSQNRNIFYRVNSGDSLTANVVGYADYLS